MNHESDFPILGVALPVAWQTVRDESTQGCVKKYGAGCIERCGRCAAYITLLTGVVIGIFGLVIWLTNDPAKMWT